MALLGTYSFLDVQGSILGPGMSFNIGQDEGIAEEGITIEMEGDKGSITPGADGSGMHNLHAYSGGVATIRLLKTSPLNAALSQGYNFQTTSSALYGQNIISIRNPVTGDTIVCTGCGFRKLPNNVNGRDGGMLDWIFNCVRIDQILGDGGPISNLNLGAV
jgi:hypothetical protein